MSTSTAMFGVSTITGTRPSCSEKMWYIGKQGLVIRTLPSGSANVRMSMAITSVSPDT